MEKSLLVLRNRMPAFVWGFAATWIALLVVMTAELVIDGPPLGYSFPVMAVVLGVFWIAGLGLLAYACSKPCTFVTVDAGATVTFTKRYPHKRERNSFAVGEISAAEVSESTDDEGDPYFFARVTSSDGESFDIAEGHDRERCAQVCGRFNQALEA